MKVKKQLLHTARIKNNCPECYSTEGLEFSFSQEEKEHPLYTRANNEIEEMLYCHHCQHTIYPVNWTEDIERVYEYNRKLVKPKSSKIRLKPLAYLIILVDVVILGVVIYLLAYR